VAENILAKLSVVISGQTAEFTKAINATNSQLKGFGKELNAVKNLAGGLLAGFSLVSIGKEIINATSEFQKFEAVLTNTLGSNSAAKQAMEDILQFAVKTPFAVNELTASYVKLANQGFKPTVEELRKLGDLASSTGKGFDQLTEAIIDAQVGEFERLKEFGIRAKKQGDQVTFTFKGVQTQTKFTADEIRKYILTLGDLEGVSGSMAAISQTLGGKISNLGDAFGQLSVNLGKMSSGPIASGITAVTSLLNSLNETLKLANLTAEDLALIGIKKFNEGLEETQKQLKETGKIGEEFNRFYMDIVLAINATNEQIADGQTLLEGFKFTGQTDTDEFKKQTFLLASYKAELQGLLDIRKKLDELVKNSTEVIPKENIGLIEDLEKKIKKAEEALKKAFTVPEVRQIQKEIKSLNEDLQFVLGKKNIDVKLNLRFDIKSLASGFDEVNDELKKQFEETGKFIESLTNKFFKTDVGKKLGKIETPQWMRDYIDGLKKGREDLKKETDAIIVDFSGLITGVAEALGQSLGEGNFKNFGKNLLKEVASFCQQLGGLMIAMGGAEIALKGAPPPVKIAAGIALVAAGAAIKSLLAKQKNFSNAGTGGGASGGGGSATAFARSGKEERISFDFRFKIQGNDLVAVLDSANEQNKRLRGG